MNFARLLLIALAFQSIPSFTWAIETNWETRFLSRALFVVDPPEEFERVDREAELLLGVEGNAWRFNGWNVDYELTGRFDYVGGPREEADLSEDFDADFFRAWIRIDNETFKLRGGRQQILFGAGALYRPLGLFDTRNISGIAPLTQGVDGVRATYFLNATSSLESWVVPARKGDRAIVGVRGEAVVKDLDVGAVFQYHPQTELDTLIDFDLELYQFGYHVKGEKTIGYWNEGRLDIEQGVAGNPVRFDTVFGIDYTFDVGEGLHALVEYFFSTREDGFSRMDLLGDNTIHQLGLLLDQPIGISLAWKAFTFIDLVDGSFQFVPQIEYSITDQAFLYLTGNWGGNFGGNEEPGRLFLESPRFNGSESKVGLTLLIYI